MVKRLLFAVTIAGILALSRLAAAPAYEVNDAHFHLTNYIQKGISASKMLEIMGDRVGRAALFGLPLQQKWDYSISGELAPSYYLHCDAELYYYSFVDAMIVHEYLALSPEDRDRFDPMICGFNPTDMYATDHIRRVLLMYPGVFSGIGEFSINKEFVSAKIAGGRASLRDRAFHNILSFAGDVGLVVLLHTDISTIISPLGKKPTFFGDLKAALGGHKETTIIWAHTGLGRMVKPTDDHVALLRELLADQEFAHVMLDISWDEVAKYVTQDEGTLAAWARLIHHFPDRILFGSDAVAPTSVEQYLKTYHVYEPLWDLLDEEAAEKVKKTNYTRVFDAARRRVRAWEGRQSGSAETPRPSTRKAEPSQREGVRRRQEL